jgi:DNA (cytosine-5)-methyltransferase 1
MPNVTIPVIDLFSGPGGLSEGFARHGERDWTAELSPELDSLASQTRPSVPAGGSTRFHIALSIEKDRCAHQTLQLRAFFRAFGGRVPAAYYSHLRGEIERAALFAAHRVESAQAEEEARLAELGVHDEKDIDRRIRAALHGADPWVLIGGPPCQAYSIVGRSRRSGIASYSAEADNRHFLYQEYLRIVAAHAPTIFVMENVKGLLSSRVKGEAMFDRILADLSEPGRAMAQRGNKKLTYRLFALTRPEPSGLFGLDDAQDFVIRMEEHGIPQARHRVILLGIRDDVPVSVPGVLPRRRAVPAGRVLGGLPRLRSGLSREDDSAEAWSAIVRSATDERWFRETSKLASGTKLQRELRRVTNRVGKASMARGNRTETRASFVCSSGARRFDQPPLWIILSAR